MSGVTRDAMRPGGARGAISLFLCALCVITDAWAVAKAAGVPGPGPAAGGASAQPVPAARPTQTAPAEAPGPPSAEKSSAAVANATNSGASGPEGGEKTIEAALRVAGLTDCLRILQAAGAARRAADPGSTASVFCPTNEVRALTAADALHRAPLVAGNERGLCTRAGQRQRSSPSGIRSALLPYPSACPPLALAALPPSPSPCIHVLHNPHVAGRVNLPGRDGH